MTSRSLLSAIGNTPLVPLRRIAVGCPVPVLVKCEHMNPGGSLDESFAMTRRLCAEEGLLVGGSAGTAVVTALRVAASGAGGPVVVVLPDSWDRYRSLPWAQGG